MRHITKGIPLWCAKDLLLMMARIHLKGFRTAMALTSDEVRRIATLARVHLSDDEVERMREQLSGILSHFETLNAIDTDDVPPTAQTLDLVNVQRADEPRESSPVDEVLANAPRREGDYLRVRAVLD